MALEQVGWYLKGTINEGLILKPNLQADKFAIDIYVDAMFTAGWGTELCTNSGSIKSYNVYCWNHRISCSLVLQVTATQEKNPVALVRKNSL